MKDPSTVPSSQDDELGPAWYFIYDIFKSSPCLKQIRDLPPDQIPHHRPAKITGYAVGYQHQDDGRLLVALIKGETTQTVQAPAYLVTAQELRHKLNQQDPHSYTLHPCTVEFEDGAQPQTAAALTFLFTGDAATLVRPTQYRTDPLQFPKSHQTPSDPAWRRQFHADRAEAARTGKPKTSALSASLEAAGVTNMSDVAIEIGPIPGDKKEWKPVWYFFYGTLARPEVLKDVLDLPQDEEPVYHPAVIIGYALAQGTPYKALIDGDTDQPVLGLAYLVQQEDHEAKLAEYETDAYRPQRCKIQLTECNETREVRGKTFMFAGDWNELKQGQLLDGVTWEPLQGGGLLDSEANTLNKVLQV